MDYFFTSESVSEGHPDKICDQLSDKILDVCLKHDPDSRVAVECFAVNNTIVVGGEVSSKVEPHIPTLASWLWEKIGLRDPETSMKTLEFIRRQSNDIAEGIGREGAGDQGVMFGYACRDTPQLMPLPIVIAHHLMERAAQLRHAGVLPFLEPDAKSQVTIEYLNDHPKRVAAVVLSHQHNSEIGLDDLRVELQRQVIEPVLNQYNITMRGAIFHINPCGKFVTGGMAADTGLTGRKIMVDSYGGMGRHGGGAFSGKDPSKVDRSAAYMARYIAKNIVAAGLAEKCEVQLCYFIGGKSPIQLKSWYGGPQLVEVNCFNPEGYPSDSAIGKGVEKVFDLSPAGIIRTLNLRQPIFEQTATYGHFGREQFSWEKIDKVEQLRDALGAFALPPIPH